MLLRVAYKRSRTTENFNVYLRGKKTRLPNYSFFFNINCINYSKEFT